MLYRLISTCIPVEIRSMSDGNEGFFKASESGLVNSNETVVEAARREKST